MRNLLLALALFLLAGLSFTALAFFQYTVIDEPIRGRLRPVLPEAVQERLRPLRAPQILRFTPRWGAEDVGPRTPLSISFLTEMDRATTEANIHIIPSVPGDFEWHARTVTFTPSEPWPLNTEITVRVERGARSRLYRRMAQPFEWRFSTLGPPRVVETEPPQGARYAFVDNRIAIRFNRLMDRASVESRLRIEPEPFNPAMEWQGEQLLLGGVFHPSTQYTVSLLKGAQDAVYGLATDEDLTWAFTTTRRNPSLTFIGPSRFASVPADTPVELKLSLVNISQIDFALYRVDVPTYTRMTNFRYGDWQRFEQETDPVRAWTVEPAARSDEEIQHTLKMEALEPGVYVLTAQAPEAMAEPQVLVVGHTALTVKRSPTELLVWATSMQDGTPVAQLTLQAYNSDGELLAEGQTDDDGLWFTHFPGSDEPIQVIGLADGDFAAASDIWQQGLEPWQFQALPWQWDLRPRAHRVFMYTDRPVYRPGQTVHFKAIVRRDQGELYEQPPAGTPVQITVKNWNEDVLYERMLETTAQGSVYDSFKLSDEVELGQWRLIAQIDGGSYETAFQIERYRKPEYIVAVRFDRPDYVNGDVFKATVSARYFFGAPAAGIHIRWTLYANDYTFPSLDGSFQDVTRQPAYQGYGREIARGEARADPSGTFTLSQSVDISNEDRSQIFTLEAEVTDPAAQPINAVASALVHRGEFYIGVQSRPYVTEAGAEATFQIRTRDLGDHAVSKDLSYHIDHVTWTRRETAEGISEWDETRTPVMEGNVSTTTSGDGNIAFVPQKGGAYHIRLEGEDDRGNRVLALGWLWAREPGRFIGWKFDDNDRIALIPDAQTYEMGDTAQVLVQSPYENARALLTVERAGLLDYRVVELKSNSEAIEVPIDKRFFPNVYVSVVLIPKGGPPGFKLGYTELRVQSNNHRINVSVEANQETYRPQDQASYLIRTTDLKGNPVPAEVSIGVADAAIYAATGSRYPDIVDAFYGRQPLAVRTGGSLAVLASRRIQPENIGGGGGPGEQQIRQLFPDEAYWNPAVETNENGVAQISFPLPNSLTTWRVTVLGVAGGTRVGQAQTDSVVTKDLIVRPVLPRFFTAGDQATIGAVVQNLTSRPQSVDLTVSTDNLDLGNSPAVRSFVVGPGEAAHADWPVTVPEAAETTITLRAVAPEASDTVQITRPVASLGERIVDLAAGQVDGPSAPSEPALTSVTVNLPEKARLASLRIDTAPSLAAGLIQGLEYLADYPYGCVEQTVSRFLPSVLIDQALRGLGLPNRMAGAASFQPVSESLQRLYRFQHFDGGWGWWEDDDTNAFQTAYVLYSLIQSERAGIDVRDTVLQDGARALRAPLVDTDDLDLKTYLVYVLTEYGQGDISLARSLQDRIAQLAPYSRAYLALTLAKLGDTESARAVVDDLARQAIETETTAHWVQQKPDAQLMTSDGQTTALVLKAMLSTIPDSPLVPKAVRWLMSQRRGGYWRTTQETAVVISALADYLALRGETELTPAYKVTVNGTPVGEVKVTPENGARPHTFTVTDLKAGPNLIQIEKWGAGTVYYSTNLSYTMPRDSVAADQSLARLTVHRQYLDPETDKPIESANVGDLVRVKLTVEVPMDMWYMQVKDPLPAGTEAVDFTLQTIGFQGLEPHYFWARPELQAQNAVFFSTYLWEGAHEFTYLIRATTVGTFRVKPTVVTPMYQPEVWGRSGSAVFVVGKPMFAGQ